MHVISVSNDYFARWPIKIDGVYAETLPDRLSPKLVQDIRDLADWWQDRFAVRVTEPPTLPHPADVAELKTRERDVLTRLREELGDEYVVRPM